VAMESISRILDWLFYDCITPVFLLLGRLLSFIFIKPFVLLHVPLWLHIILLAVLLAFFSFYLRRILKVEEKVHRFNALFAEKRRRQQNLQYISEKYSREALYRVTDDELNSDFNTYLAHHYARYVTVYMLPIFLVLAWLNSVFSESYLTDRFGYPFVMLVPENRFGMKGVSVTAIFLFTYVLCLIIGFHLMRRKKKASQEDDSQVELL
jgi:uncharacterized membrane protein (DUF106 family)